MIPAYFYLRVFLCVVNTKILTGAIITPKHFYVRIFLTVLKLKILTGKTITLVLLQLAVSTVISF